MARRELTPPQRRMAIGLGVVVLALVAWFVWRMWYNNHTYKAVFLTNGQVYFGKVYMESFNPVVLHDIYYLQQQTTGQDTKDTNSQVQLIKLGNEIHGPMDAMRINKDQILYMEDLKEDGQVAKTIKSYKANGNQSAPSSTPSETKS